MRNRLLHSTMPFLALAAGLACPPLLGGPAAAEAPDLARCRTAVQNSPDSPEAHKSLGNVLILAGRYGEAVREFRAALRLDPRYAKGYHNLGRALCYERDYAGSVAAYRKAIALQPYYPAAYADLGLAYGEAGHPTEAMAAYRQAIRQLPSDLPAHERLGDALSGAGRHAEALAEFEKAMALDPDNMARVSPVARELDVLGRRADAWKLLRQAEVLAPLCPVTHFNEARFCMQEGRWQEAASHLRVTLKAPPASPPAHLMLGTALYSLGQKAAARAEWRQAQETGDAENARVARENLAQYR